MASCASHAKVAVCRCEKRSVAIAHRPCERGCYDCRESELVVKALVVKVLFDWLDASTVRPMKNYYLDEELEQRMTALRALS